MDENSTDARPSWDFKEISEADFRRVYEFGRIESITAHMEMTGADTAREWLTASRKGAGSIILPNGWEKAWEFYGSWSVPGLLTLTYLGKRMRDRLNIIDKWEVANEKDRQEYDRLKDKFGKT